MRAPVIIVVLYALLWLVVTSAGLGPLALSPTPMGAVSIAAVLSLVVLRLLVWFVVPGLLLHRALTWAWTSWGPPKSSAEC